MPDATPAAAQDAAAAPEPAPEPAPDAAATEPAPGADAAATQPGAAETQPAESSLAETVDNFWHYAQIARYDLASAAGNRILNSGAQPAEILAAFEQVAQRRSATRRAAGGSQETLDGALVRWQGIEPLRDVATRLTQTINQGYSEHVMNQEFIQQQIDHLGDNERAYRNSVGRLRQSGQYAVPMMLRYLRDPAKQQLHGPIRNALRDLGRAALSPLLAATDTRDPNLLIPVVTVLGDIGYDAAVPYLVRAGTEPNAPDSVRIAVDKALQRLGVDARAANPADLFTDLGEKYYYDTAAVQSDKRSPTTPVWVWDEQAGLSMKPVSSPIFNEVMAMLAAEEALKVGAGQADAASLWLAANNKREAEMPAENPTDGIDEGRPPAASAPPPPWPTPGRFRRWTRS
jgi:hypothetical protein